MIGDYIYDGEIHALNEAQAYAVEYIDEDFTFTPLNSTFAAICNKFGNKYKNYLEKCGIIENVDFFDPDLAGQAMLIYTPPIADKKATVSIKFYRQPNDGLDEASNSR